MFIKLLTSTVIIKLLDPEQKFRIRIRFRLKKLGSSRIRIRIRIRIRNTGPPMVTDQTRGSANGDAAPLCQNLVESLHIFFPKAFSYLSENLLYSLFRLRETFT